MLMCEYFDDIVEDLENHLIPIHNIDLFNNLLNLKIIPETSNLQVHLLEMHLKVHSCEDCDQKVHMKSIRVIY